MNNKPKPHPHAEQIKAWADGFTIQIQRSNGEWEDIDLPSWNEEFEYRIKPNNEPWSPKTDEKYFYLDVFNGEFYAVDNTWNSTDTDYALRRNNNIFSGKEEAEAAIPRVKTALKGELKISAPNVEIFQLDGKPLTDGEKALIRAFRNGRLCRQFSNGSSVIVEGHDKVPCGVTTHRHFVAFFMYSPMQDGEVRNALEQIIKEQEANREA